MCKSLTLCFFFFFFVFKNSYGGERYENRDLQVRVRERFGDLQALDAGRVPWTVVDAAQSIEKVQADIWTIVQETMESVVATGKPLRSMWQEEPYDLELTSADDDDDKEN